MIVLAGVVGAQPTQALRNVKIGDPVPTFSAKDLRGNPVSKADYKGKVLLLVFARPKHAKSMIALQSAGRICRDYGGTKLAVLAVSAKPGAKEHFKQVVSQNNLDFPIALDPERKIYGDFGLLVSPTTLLIDEGGLLRYELAHIPRNYERRLRIHIDHLLGKINQVEHDSLLARLKEGRSESRNPRQRRVAFAQALLDQGKFDQAVAILIQLRSEMDSTLAAALLGKAYLGLGKIDEAAKCLDPIATVSPAPTALKLALAELEIRRKNDQKAEAYLLDALKSSPKQGRILLDLGRLYERRGDLSKAVECYRKALEEAYGKKR